MSNRKQFFSNLKRLSRLKRRVSSVQKRVTTNSRCLVVVNVFRWHERTFLFSNIDDFLFLDGARYSLMKRVLCPRHCLLKVRSQSRTSTSCGVYQKVLVIYIFSIDNKVLRSYRSDAIFWISFNLVKSSLLILEWRFFDFDEESLDPYDWWKGIVASAKWRVIRRWWSKEFEVRWSNSDNFNYCTLTWSHPFGGINIEWI